MKIRFSFLIITSIVLSFCCRVYSSELGKSRPDTLLLRQYVEHLSSYDMPRNVYQLETLDSASKYIQSIFSKYSHKVEIQEYQIASGSVRNIIASFGPEHGKRIVIGAHYDVCGDQPGADDNASGVAGLLELARLFSLLDSAKISQNINLIAYTLEEPPYFRTEEMGSYIHAKSMRDRNVDIDVMISLEMIGYFSTDPNSQRFPIGFLEWFYPTTGNFIAIVTNFQSHSVAAFFKEKMRKHSKVPVEQITAPSFITGVDFSDHLNYWNFNYVAFMITDTAFLRNMNYHQYSDTPATLNYASMSEVVAGLLFSVLDF